MHELLRRLGFGAAKRPLVFAGVWLICLLVLLGLRQQFGGEFVNDYTVPGSQASAGRNLLASAFPQQSGYAGSAVFHSLHGHVAAESSAVVASIHNLSKLPDMVYARDPLADPSGGGVSADGTIVNAPVSFSVPPQSLTQDYLDQMNAAVRPARRAGLTVDWGGGAGQVAQQTHDKKSEVIGIVLALILLFFMFWSFVAAALPLIAAVFSVAAGLSLIGLIASGMTLPTTAPVVATLLGLGVAIDYGLFLVARQREGIDEGLSVPDSIARANATSGGAVVVAGSTVVIAILGLYVAGVPFVGALGMSSALVVAITIISAVTLVPAFLGIAGGRIRSLGDRRTARRQKAQPPTPEEVAAQRAERERIHEHSAFARWGRMVSRQPWPWAIATLIVLCVLSIPLLSMRLGQLDAGTNPKSDSSRRAYDLIAQGFGPGANGPLVVVAQFGHQSGSATQSTLTSLSQQLHAMPDVAAVSAPSLNSNQTVATITVIPKTSPQASATETLSNSIRSDVLAKQLETTYLVGTTAGYIDFTEKISQRIPWLIGIVVLLALILLTSAFRSIVIGLKAAVMNLLSVGAAYGVIVAVFQWGWGSSLIGINEKVPIPSYVPMMIFAIVFGLSMDYEVFLISRVHEAWVATRDSHRAVAIGIGATARVITTAAAIMVAVFASFVLASDPTVKMLAVGMAVAVLIDASIVRMILVPSVMTLLGEWAWWLPRWMDRVIPNIDIEGTGADSHSGVAAGPSGDEEPGGEVVPVPDPEPV